MIKRAFTLRGISDYTGTKLLFKSETCCVANPDISCLLWNSFNFLKGLPTTLVKNFIQVYIGGINSSKECQIHLEKYQFSLSFVYIAKLKAFFDKNILVDQQL